MPPLATQFAPVAPDELASALARLGYGGFAHLSKRAKAYKRARVSGLLHGSGLENRPNIAALEEFLFHGLKYVFPAKRGELTRGVATSYGAAPLRALIAPTDDPIPVWPYEEGNQRGVSLAPLYKTAPLAALRDESFYELLVLAD